MVLIDTESGVNKAVGIPHMVGDTLLHPIGSLIATWALFENVFDALLESVIKANQTNELGWQKRAFAKRYDVLKREWQVFAEGQRDLVAELTKPMELVHRGKEIRDSVCHKRMSSGNSEKGMFIRFAKESPRDPFSKPFYPADIKKAVAQVSQATTALVNLLNGHPTSPLSSRSKSLLQLLPRNPMWTIPTSLEPSPPPPSS